LRSQGFVDAVFFLFDMDNLQRRIDLLVEGRDRGAGSCTYTFTFVHVFYNCADATMGEISVVCGLSLRTRTLL
jgi:hypothetical protein